MELQTFEYPELEAAKSVLAKIGADPSTRIDEDDQDFEYTSCDYSELEAYVALYLEGTTSGAEKRVLGCFLLQSLDDYLLSHGAIHANQEDIFSMLFSDLHIHKAELEYWSQSSESPVQEWAIARYLRDWCDSN